MDFSENQPTLAGENYRSRFFEGVPNIPNKKKDSMAIYLLFIQHIIKSMNKDAKAAVVVPTGFLTAAQGIAFKIRKYIIENKLLRGVISMPSNIFANTGTNVSIIFLDACGNDKALLMDASSFGTTQRIDGSNQRTCLSDDEIQRIIQTFNTKQEIDDFSVLVPLDEIEQKKFSFSAGQFFNVKIEYSDLSPDEFQAKIDAFKSELKNLFAESQKLDTQILNNLENLTYEKN
jgi:type I restriction enzyme M protein